MIAPKFQKTNLLKQTKSRITRKNITKVEDLNEEEKQIYRHYEQRYLDQYLLTWKQVIQKQLKYKNPNLINANNLPTNESFYVFPTFMTSGKQYFYVSTKE